MCVGLDLFQALFKKHKQLRLIINNRLKQDKSTTVRNFKDEIVGYVEPGAAWKLQKIIQNHKGDEIDIFSFAMEEGNGKEVLIKNEVFSFEV